MQKMNENNPIEEFQNIESTEDFSKLLATIPIGNPEDETAQEYDSDKDPEVQMILEAFDLDKLYMQSRLQESVQDQVNAYLDMLGGDLSQASPSDMQQKTGYAPASSGFLYALRQYKSGKGISLGKAGSHPLAPPRPEYSREMGSEELNKLKDLVDSVADEINSLEHIVAQKFNMIYKIAYNVAIGKSDKDFALIAGSGGIGKTWTVGQALDAARPIFEKKGFTQKTVYGSIGKSSTSLATFLYDHRAKFMLLMDDADGFLTAPDVQNYMKAAFEDHPITFPDTIRDRINKKRAKEGFEFKIDRDKLLRENVVSLTLGDQLFEETVDYCEAQRLAEKFGFLSNNRITEKKDNTRNKKLKGMLSPYSRLYEADDDSEDDDLEGKAADEFLDTHSEIPEAFLFESKMIFISNLSLADLDEAVATRMTKYELTLTPEEFLVRVGSCLKGIKMKGDYSDEMKEWGKEQAFRMLAVAIEAREKNAKLMGQAVAIHKNSLQFRMIPTLTSELLNRVEEYAAKTGQKNKDKILSAISPDYVKFVLLPNLRGDRRAKMF